MESVAMAEKPPASRLLQSATNFGDTRLEAIRNVVRTTILRGIRRGANLSRPPEWAQRACAPTVSFRLLGQALAKDHLGLAAKHRLWGLGTRSRVLPSRRHFDFREQRCVPRRQFLIDERAVPFVAVDVYLQPGNNVTTDDLALLLGPTALDFGQARKSPVR
jgi:hypothetical protein